MTAPVPREYASKFDNQTTSTYGMHQVSTGPYMIKNDASGNINGVGYKPGQLIDLVRNPNWNPTTSWRPAHVDEVLFKEGYQDPTVMTRTILSGSADVNGDSRPDVCGRHKAGVYCAISDGRDVPTHGSLWLPEFTDHTGWSAPEYYRTIQFPDVNGDGKADLIAGGGPGGGPRVLVLGGEFLAAANVAAAYANPVVNIFVGPDSARGGIRVGSADVDGDGRDDLLAASGEGQPAQVSVFLGKNITDTTPTIDQTLSVFGGGALPGGVFVG